jgi:DNA-binding protein HU-beta
MITRSDFIEKVARESGVTKKDTKLIADTMERVALDIISDGEDVRILNCVALTVKDSAPRTGRNPKTGETIQVPAKKRVSAKIGKALKDAANRN